MQSSLFALRLADEDLKILKKKNINRRSRLRQALLVGSPPLALKP
jgi:hypothetical protein